MTPELKSEQLENGVSALREWFINRRFEMERAITAKNVLDHHGFTGLNLQANDQPEGALFADLVQGTPECADTLSVDARNLKADMYTQIFREATDLDHPCRIPGSTYLRCLKDHASQSQSERQPLCMASFNAFDSCRKNLHREAEERMAQGLKTQERKDNAAKALFDQRVELLKSQ